MLITVEGYRRRERETLKLTDDIKSGSYKLLRKSFGIRPVEDSYQSSNNDKRDLPSGRTPCNNDKRRLKTKRKEENYVDSNRVCVWSTKREKTREVRKNCLGTTLIRMNQTCDA